MRSLVPRLRSVVWCLCVLGVALHAEASRPTVPAVSAEEDHRRMMEQLGIKTLRWGADPNHPDSPNAVNYDEAKAWPYPKLPEALVFNDGTPVRDAQDWRRRRVELLEDFDREVYGRVPAKVPAVTWGLVSTRQESLGGRAVLVKELLARVDSALQPQARVEFSLLLTLPAVAHGPVPVVVHFGFPKALLARFPAQPGPSWQEIVLSQGWGVAELIPTEWQADKGSGLYEGIIGLCNEGRGRRPEDWGALRAWAWGASRAMDYLQTDPAVNPRLIAIEGLSRYGKAALVTMAYDERFAFGFIGSSGAAGAKPHRRNFGENVENIASSSEYHWMAGNYLKYAGPLNWNDLPVDSHELIALCAPRPVFISCGAFEVEGQWIDQRGMFAAAVAAGPVYRLLGRRDLGTDQFPPKETALIGGELAFRQHAGGHTTYPNWGTFFEWVGRYLQ